MRTQLIITHKANVVPSFLCKEFMSNQCFPLTFNCEKRETVENEVIKLKSM